jgi:hypothetical protein
MMPQGNCAGSAIALGATFLGAGGTLVQAQPVEQGCAWFNIIDRFDTPAKDEAKG